MNHPSYIFSLLQDELKNAQVSLLRKVATKYNLDVDELINDPDLIPVKTRVIPNTEISINIEKTIEPRKAAADTNRCAARVWGRGNGGRCIRQCMENREYCKQHMNNLKHGRFDENIPLDKFPKKSIVLYK
jgi:hypothetical protein